MPEGKNFHNFWMGGHSVVQIIMNTGQVNTANTRQIDGSSPRADQWLRSEDLNCELQFDRTSIRGFRPIGNPPFGSIEDSFARTGDYQDRGDSLRSAQLFQKIRRTRRLSLLSLRNRGQQFGFICWRECEGFIPFQSQHGHCRAIRKTLRINLNSPAADRSSSNERDVIPLR